MLHSISPLLINELHSGNVQHLFLLTVSQLKLLSPSHFLLEVSLHLGVGRRKWKRVFAQFTCRMACDLMPSKTTFIEGQELVE